MVVVRRLTGIGITSWNRFQRHPNCDCSETRDLRSVTVESVGDHETGRASGARTKARPSARSVATLGRRCAAYVDLFPVFEHRWHRPWSGCTARGLAPFHSTPCIKGDSGSLLSHARRQAAGHASCML